MSIATTNVVSMAPSRQRALLLAARPATLPAACVPVVVGSALAYGQGHFAALAASAALIGALLIQIGTNLFNDYADFRKGADTADRLGPARATQQGWLSPATVLAAALGCFGAAALTGVYLVAIGGWPIVIVGLASIVAGMAYTGGPWPLAYVGLGEPFVFVFFGLVAVVATYFVQAHAVSALSFWAAAPVGLLATAILVVNNLRDRSTDALAHKNTLAVRWGERAACIEYTLLVAAAYLVPLIGWLGGWLPWGWLFPLATLPQAVRAIRAIWRKRGRALNPQLGATARMELLYGVLLALGVLL